MIILHGALLDTGLFLWAEAPAQEAPTQEIFGATTSKDRAPYPAYPYCADFDTLARTIRSLPVGFRPTKKRLQRATAWLPTQGGVPHPSSELIAERPAGRAQVGLGPWALDGLLLTPVESYRVLKVYLERASALHGLLQGADLQHLLEATRFAGSLVARQRYLPDMERMGARWQAQWRPVWLGDDADELRRLADGMPPSARALTAEDADAPPDSAATTLLEPFVAAMVDQIVRSRGGLAIKSPKRDGPVADRWLRALRGDDPRVLGRVKELEPLRQQIRQWREPIEQAAAAPFRLSFRLEEPGGAAASPQGKRSNGRSRKKTDLPRKGRRGWFVRYLLQSNEDPDLLVPTADAWVARGRKAAILSSLGANLHETLVILLGQAASLCPQIAQSLHSAKPSGYSLDARGAHQFLTSTAPTLQQAGFGTTLPPWWTGRGTEQRLSVRARVDTPPLSETGAPDPYETLGFEWEVCVGGQPLSRAELEALAKLKEPLQKVQGHWIEAEVEEIHAALEFFKGRKAGALTAWELVRLALGSADSSAGIRFDGVVATGWMDVLLTRLEDKTQIGQVEVPEQLRGELRPYQQRGYDWLDFLRAWGFGALLADDMGLGKTIQTLALLLRERECGEDRPVLIVCPTSVLSNWEHEAARFTPTLRCHVHHGPTRPRGHRFADHALEHALVLTSYSLLQRDLEDLSALQWSGLVLDEAQNIKNPDTQQARAARAIQADYRVALTGTPVQNHVGDLWSIMDFLNPGSLGSAADFRRNFLLPIEAHRDREASERLQQMTSPFILRRLKTDRAIISDLPEKHEMKVYCALTREQGKLYEEAVAEAEARIRDSAGIERHGVILATLTKLKQVCNHPAHYLGDGSPLPRRSGKLTRLSEMLEETVASGDRAVVFTQFAVMGTLLQEHLQQLLGREVLYMHGGTPKASRDTMIRRFQAEGNAPPVFVLSLKAGGLGLNLTAANHVFHFDRWWNPAVENQATDRAFRIGQTRRVQVHKFVCAGTLEERIDAMIERKAEIAEEIVGTGEGWISKLSDDELHHMLALDGRAIRE